MKKTIAFLSLLLTTVTFSQSYVGFLNDNYSGVHAVINNPADIVDSRYRLDVNLFSFGAHVSNNYAGVNFSELIKGDDFDFDKYGTRVPKENNRGVVNLDILGPSFMFNLKPKHAIAISTRLRGIANVNNVHGDVIRLAEDGFDSTQNYNIDLKDDFNSNANVWGEIGATYATILMDKKEHFVKGGITLKYLKGLAYGQAYGENLKANYRANNSLIESELDLSGSAHYGHTANVSEDSDDFEIAEGANGFGGDIGFTYEWRPKLDDYAYPSKDSVKVYYNDVNKYKLKFDLAITDVGSINYKNAKLDSYDVTGKYTQADFDTADAAGDIDIKLNELFNQPYTTEGITAKLPTALRMNADWNINNMFYVNASANVNIATDEKNSNNIENNYTLTPRFEMKWVSAYIPLSIYQYSNFQAGFGFRAGPLFVGSSSILTNLFKDNSRGADIYLGLKVPIYQSRPKDKDEDGILDKVDKCPETPGPEENNGCPWGDKDGDGVKDNEDKCPEEAGSTENNGCPWGDKDGDGVADNIDECPDTAGLKEFKGCPDTDGDGIPDKEDKCPKLKGEKLYKGCPKDSDGDGIIDTEDKCPEVAGIAANNGCPEKKIVLSEEAKKTIDSYAKSIYFNSGKTTFRTGVAGKLDMIVDVMNQYPEANFAIEGHTDGVGNAESNRRLSERRAKAVLDYLVRKGITPSRLSSYGFGEEYPIDTNKTRAGRANNRRVEIKLRK